MLQEVDDRTDRTGRIDQTAEIARLTGLHAEFGRQIDFILYRAAGVLEPGEVRVLDEPVASDHRPILAEFRVR